MKPQQSYRYMIRNTIAPFLKARGFARSGETFRIERNNNLGLINFQKSNRSNGDAVIFTVNLGIISRCLYQFEGCHVPIETLTEADSHWRRRLGHLTPANEDTWWRVDKRTDVGHIGSELIEFIDLYGIPEMTRYMTDEKLTELWLSGKSPGLTNTQRLECLSVMLKSAGQHELLSKVIKELREAAAGTPYAGSAEVHIKLLSERIP